MSRAIIYGIMDLAIEDATPLFDVVNVVIAARATPNEQEARRLAKRYVRALVQGQYLEVVRDCLALSNENHRHLVRLNQADAMREIESETNWEYHPRQGAAEVWIAVGATDQGQRSHFMGHIVVSV